MHLPVFTNMKPDGKRDEEWNFEHEQVCGFIRQFVDDNVYNHICNETHARTLWNKLEQLMGINFDDKVFALMVLAFLPESWKTLKISITNTAPNGTVNMELVKTEKLNEEMRKRSQASSSLSHPDVLVEKDVSSTNGDSTDLELVPPTSVPRQVGDEGQVDEPDEDDAPIKVGSEDEEDDVHQPAPTPVASPIPLRRSEE
ncbi:hypothetical protein JRO89_XSUnG0043600 [Xanthoceras sorbifolium]|uniref:Retrovirus-related Pol polyprotein from transposon TNT 1-94 n=1 Tax=Xanthoceras sorbifolium TaxID=99658 RepID=A0ABQ8GZX3_9ROSI|nr:hypothetical protein JRO89_XSUnG0043600 [Xanthoceras sorbifolium]